VFEGPGVVLQFVGCSLLVSSSDVLMSRYAMNNAAVHHAGMFTQ